MGEGGVCLCTPGVCNKGLYMYLYILILYIYIYIYEYIYIYIYVLRLSYRSLIKLYIKANTCYVN